MSNAKRRSRRVAETSSSRPLHKRIILHPITVLFVLCAGVLIVGSTYNAVASTYTVHAKVPAPPLTEGATITSQTNGTKLGSGQLTINGTCPANSYVKLYDNNIFLGAALCVHNSFQITISLFDGTNVLRSQDFNTTDDAGPITSTVTVNYQHPQTSGSGSTTGQSSPSSSNSGTVSGSNVPSGSGINVSNPLNNTVPPLLLLADFHYQTFVTGFLFKWSLELEGGKPPYTVYINWGDGQHSALHFPTDPKFLITHDYKKSGYYVIAVRLVDASGSSQLIQLAALIKEPGASGIFSATSNEANSAQSASPYTNLLKHVPAWLKVAAPSYLIIVLMLISFWLGEREGYLNIFKRRSSRRHRASRR